MKRFFVDGCFDSFHYGHAHLLYQAKQLCDELVVGTHSDEELTREKNTPFFSFEERIEILRYCRFIDVLILNPVPYCTLTETLDKYDCDKFVHGDEQTVLTSSKQDALLDVKKNDRLVKVPSTHGISTSNLAYRISRHRITNKDTMYLRTLYKKMKPPSCVNLQKRDEYIVIISSWEFITKRCLEFVNDVRTKTGKFIVAKISSSSNYYNMLEKAITLCSLTPFDEIVFDDIEPDIYFTDDYSSIVEKISSSQIFEQKVGSEIAKIEQREQLTKKYIDSGLYIKIINEQLRTLKTIIDNIDFNEKDLIVFDLDETVLCNLMYDGFKNDDNISSGLNPLISDLIIPCLSTIPHSFVTGRRESIRELTEQNLRLLGINYVHLFMMEDTDTRPVSEYKTQCMQQIENEGFTVKIVVGDQISDISSGIGIPFLIFNPFFF